MINVFMWSRLISALIAVESGGNWNAHSISEDARGGLQIRECVIRDVNRIYGTNFQHDDAYNPRKAKAICILYLKYWGKIHNEKNRKSRAGYEVYSRIWNGGPNGATYKRLKLTDGYWTKVRFKLKELEGGTNARSKNSL